MRDTLLILFKTLLIVAIPLAAFATGLRASDPFWLWRRPKLLARSLLAVLVVVPIVTALLVEILRPSQVARAGIMIAILSIGIAPVQALKRSRAMGARVAYEVGLDEALLLLATLYIPGAVALHGAIFHHAIRLDPGEVARLVFVQMLIPLAFGVVFARQVPQLVERVGGVAKRFVDISMAIVALFALLVAGRSLFDLGVSTWLSCVVVSASAIAIGHVFAAREPEIRSALVAFSVLRFPGLAFLMVAAVPGGRVLIPVVLAYILTSALLLALYTALMARAQRKQPAPPIDLSAPSPAHRK